MNRARFERSDAQAKDCDLFGWITTNSFASAGQILGKRSSKLSGDSLVVTKWRVVAMLGSVVLVSNGRHGATNGFRLDILLTRSVAR